MCGIKHVYTTLTTLFRYSLKRCVRLKDVHAVLEIPELKIAKPSDTKWLAHEKYVCIVKKCYIAIVAVLVHIYENFHETEAFGINKILMKSTTLFAIYLLDILLPQVSKLSKCLQTEKLDLSVISSLVDATLHTLDDVLLPAVQMKSSLNLSYSYEDIMKFQNEIDGPFYCLLKENIQNHVCSQDIVTSFSIFDPNIYPKSPSDTYGNEKIKTLLHHYGRELPVKTIAGEHLLCQLLSPLAFQLSGKHFDSTWQSNQKMTLTSS